MAISPQQLNESFMKEVDRLEETIDKTLNKKSISKGDAVSMDVPSGLTDKHFEILRSRYISAGWSSVKISHDQREGSWMTFKY